MGFEKFQLDTFKNLPKVIAAYVSQIGDDRLDLKRNQEAWTIKEHIFHIVEVQELMLNRIKKFLSEPKPVIEPYSPMTDGKKVSKSRSLKSAFAKYRKFRKEQFLLLKNATEEDLAKDAQHKEFTKYTLQILLNHAICHEYWHMYRIEEIWLKKDEFFC
ncbi:MAG: DinB family protein [Spirochaetaceae bacterium]|nr:MAG: DinB family protein [Spirochaetaceae bacterium]